MPFLDLTTGWLWKCTNAKKFRVRPLSSWEKLTLLSRSYPWTWNCLQVWRTHSGCFTYTFKMSSISEFQKSDFAGYRFSSHSLLFNFGLICPDSAAARSALPSVIKRTKRDLERWNCGKLIWPKPDIQRFLKIWHCFSMWRHTPV